jgi:hypothetical protein
MPPESKSGKYLNFMYSGGPLNLIPPHVPNRMHCVCRCRANPTAGYICFRNPQKASDIARAYQTTIVPVFIKEVYNAFDAGLLTKEGEFPRDAAAPKPPVPRNIPPRPTTIPPGVSPKAFKVRYQYYYTSAENRNKVYEGVAMSVDGALERQYHKFLATGTSGRGTPLVPDVWPMDRPQTPEDEPEATPQPEAPPSLPPEVEARFTLLPMPCVRSDEGSRGRVVPVNEGEPIQVPETSVVIAAPAERKKSRSPRNAERHWKMDVRLYHGAPDVIDRLITEEFGSDVYYKKRGKHWDGYHRHSCVVFPNFLSVSRYEMVIEDILEVCFSSSPYDVRDSEGRNSPFVARVIIFISLREPSKVEVGEYHEEFMSLMTTIREVSDRDEQGPAQVVAEEHENLSLRGLQLGEDSAGSGETRAMIEQAKVEAARERRDSGGGGLDTIVTI